jgi:soluble lytic murein transglycosylase
MMSRWRSRLVVIAALAVMVPTGLQQDEPDTQKTGRLDRLVTGSIPQSLGKFDAPDIAALKHGLDALSARDIAEARQVRDGLPSGSLDRHILTWAIAVGGGSSVPSGEIAAAARELPTWPGMQMLRTNSERALFKESPDPDVVVRAFGGTAPQTAEGAIILARAHVALGDTAAAQAMLGPFWRITKLDAGDEAAILAEFGTVIKQADHRFRMERMLYAERVKSAQRLSAHAGAPELQAAWAAVLRNDKTATKLLAAVPGVQRSAGYIFVEAKRLRRAKKFAEAAAVMEKAPRDAQALVDPDAWWVERRVLSRELMDAGQINLAYAVASSHAAESPSSAVDAEFHAGWYALRGLKDAKLGSKHFMRIAELADGPISLSRAYYWLGRAAEAGGPGDAAAYFAKAARYGTAFYGQLAAQRIGLPGLNIPNPEPTAADHAAFSQRGAVRAIERLEQAGSMRLADRLYRDLGTQLTSPGELALLAAMAEKRGDHFLALKVSKSAANRGVDIGALAHPLGAIPSSANMTAAGEALAYAIARQESEFNVGAISSAGALGLLQLMPGTAKEVAKRSGLTYSQTRLTTDAGYNATLGAAFLSEQLGRFDGSYILTFAGYNAGPKRARQWVKRYGDPRGKDIDTVVDWIERIPYTETRSYVQRVMENYQVYKMRLTGKADIVADLVRGRR